MALTNSKGGVEPKKHKLERSNIERAENDQMVERRLAGEFQKYPQQLHKAGGLTKDVQNDEECAAALAKGWLEDIRDVEALESAEEPTMVSQMTLSQAKDFIEAHRGDAAFVAAQIADETGHGNRAAVLALLEAAADALPSKAPKKAAPKKK